MSDGPERLGARAGLAGALAQRPAAQLATALALGIAGGLVASWLRVPLAWMLGPLFVCGAAAIAGVPLRPVPWGREIGQAAVGLAIGLRFTPPVIVATAALLPAMVVATLYVIAVTTAAAFLMRRLGGVDHKTAFFATAAAGMADMATVARERGGDPSAVAVVHAIRVSAVVFVVPLIVFAVGETGAVLTPEAVAATNWPVLVVLMAFCTGAALLLRPLPVPNPWLIGPIMVGMAASAVTGLATGVPNLVIVLAQLLIGIALGTRFQRKLLLSLPRVVAAALAVAAVLITAAAAGGAVLAQATGLPFATSFLAVAPAGVTEMVLTAKVMQLDTASVTAFHVMRIAVIAATILLTFGLFERIVRLVHGSRI